MPPPSSHKPAFTDAQKLLVARWIEQGAKYALCWSFIAPVRPEIDWQGSEAVDFLIDEQLEQAGSVMSEPASAETLLRRISLSFRL